LVRVLSYNIWNGGGERLALVARVIRGARPAAVALQEATAESAAALAHELGMELVFGEGNSIFGLHVAWLSRLPVRAAANHRLPALSKSLLEIDTGAFRLFTTHLASRHEEHAYPRHGEVAALLEVLRGVAGPHVLAGDLNSLQPGDRVGTPPSGTVPFGEAVPGAARSVLTPLADAGYVDCFRALHPAAGGFTYPAHAPWLRLDYVFASPAAASRLRACDVVAEDPAATASDHLAVLATFA
jgi:exodeoxyribonuclease-3